MRKCKLFRRNIVFLLNWFCNFRNIKINKRRITKKFLTSFDNIKQNNEEKQQIDWSTIFVKRKLLINSLQKAK